MVERNRPPASAACTRCAGGVRDDEATTLPKYCKLNISRQAALVGAVGGGGEGGGRGRRALHVIVQAFEVMENIARKCESLPFVEREIWAIDPIRCQIGQLRYMHVDAATTSDAAEVTGPDTSAAQSDGGLDGVKCSMQHSRTALAAWHGNRYLTASGSITGSVRPRAVSSLTRFISAASVANDISCGA